MRLNSNDVYGFKNKEKFKAIVLIKNLFTQYFENIEIAFFLNLKNL